MQFLVPYKNGTNECERLSATFSGRKLSGSNLLAFGPQIDVERCKSNIDEITSVPVGISCAPDDYIKEMFFMC